MSPSIAPTMIGIGVSSRRFVSGAMYGVKDGGPSGTNPILSGYSWAGMDILSSLGYWKRLFGARD